MGVKARDETDCAVIWLHGQGETEVGWQYLLSGFETPEIAGRCRWLWPRARITPCTARGGAPTCQWFDTIEFPVCSLVRGIPDRHRRPEDPKQVTAAVMAIHAVIDALVVEGVPPERIVLGGFGQGAALIPHTMLRYKGQLAGGAMISGWVPCIDTLEEAQTKESNGAKIMWLHGARDAVVHPDVAMEHAHSLKEMGTKLDFRVYPELTFGVSEAALACVMEFIQGRLKIGAKMNAKRDRVARRATLREIAAVKALAAKDGSDVLRGGLMGDGESSDSDSLKSSSDEDKDFDGNDSGGSTKTGELQVKEETPADVLASLSQKMGIMSPTMSKA